MHFLGWSTCCSLLQFSVADILFGCFGSYVALITFSCNVEILLFFLVSVDISVAAIKNFIQDLGFGCLKVLLPQEFEKFRTEE